MKSRIIIGIAILALLVAVIVLALVFPGGSATPDKEIPGISTLDYIFTGHDDTLYLFSGDNISAISSGGHLVYNYTLPEGLGFCSRWFVVSLGDKAYLSRSGHPIACEDNGTLYVYLKPGNKGAVDGIASHDYNDTETSVGYGVGVLLAIGHSGRLLWSLNVTDLSVKFAYIHPSSDVSMYAHNGLVYVFHQYNESVISANGSVLWSIGDVSDPGSVDDSGNLYVVNAIRPWAGQTIPQPILSGSGVQWDYRIPGSVLDSYYPNGSLRWRQYSFDLARHQDNLDNLPLYNNGVVYMPSEKSLTAIASNGSRLWVKTFNSDDYNYSLFDIMKLYGYGLIYPSYDSKIVPSALLIDYGFRIYGLMPFDSQGNIYVEHPLAGISGVSSYSYLIEVSTDGREVSDRIIYASNYTMASNSMLLNVATPYYSYANIMGNIDNLTTGALSAYDPGTGALLWTFTVPVDKRGMVTIIASNLKNLIPADELNDIDSMSNFSYNQNSDVVPVVEGGVQSCDVSLGTASSTSASRRTTSSTR